MFLLFPAIPNNWVSHRPSFGIIEIFSPVVKRVSKQVVGWKEKIFAFVEKEMLIKAMVQAIPTYTELFSFFLKV